MILPVTGHQGYHHRYWQNTTNIVYGLKHADIRTQKKGEKATLAPIKLKKNSLRP